MKRIPPWLVGTLTATLLMATLAAFNGLRYADTSNALMMKTFAGFMGGVPAHYHAELHTALSWLCSLLHTTVPGVAWLSVLQLLLLWFSIAAIARSLARIAVEERLPLWTGWALAVAYCLAFAFMAVCRVDHESTAAVAGAAAVARLMSVDYRRADDKQVLRGLLPCVALLLCAYCFSARAGLVSLAAWLLGGAWIHSDVYSHREVAARGTAAHKGVRGLSLGLAIGVFCMAGFWCVRAVESSAMQDYTRWQSARAALCDNPAFPSAVTDAMLARAGWTSEQFGAVSTGFLYDSDITAESMTRLAELLPAEPTGVFAFARRAALGVTELWRLGGAGGAQMLLCAALAVGALVVCLMARKRAGTLIALPLALAAGFVGLGLSGWHGAPGEPQALSAFAPVAMLLLCAALRAAPAASVVRWKRYLCVLLGAALCALGVAGAVSCQAGVNALPVRAPAFEAALYEYALERPEKLIFYSPELAEDTRMFPDLARVPQNIVLPDASAVRGDALALQFKRFGLDAGRFKPNALLGENVLFAGTDRGPWRILLPYLHQRMSGTYNWASYENAGDVRLYRLCER